nr:hypothetical protein [Escherichia coli]
MSSPRQTRSYSYSTTGRLTGVHTTAANLDIRIPYATDPAGNRLPDPELHPDSTLSMWPDNRIARDAHYLYRYDRHGRIDSLRSPCGQPAHCVHGLSNWLSPVVDPRSGLLIPPVCAIYEKKARTFVRALL